MIRRVIKKAGAVLLAAGLSIGMCSPSVSAAVKVNKTVQAKAARYVQPEEWNREELTAYQFNSEDDLFKYMISGGLHLYNKNYKVKDHWVKIKIADPGIFTVGTINTKDTKIALYDATKKKIIEKDLDALEEDYIGVVKAGEEFYVKLPAKIDKIFLVTGVIKAEFHSMASGKNYYELGKGTTTYHPFSVSKRSKVNFDISSLKKKSKEVQAYVEKNINGKWQKIGYSTTVKPGEFGTTLMYGLQSGKYRLVLKNSKDQIINVEYKRKDMDKEAAYKKSKAVKIKSDIQNVYTAGEQAARWYKVSVASTKKRSVVTLSKYSVGGGFQFKIYQNGKVIKTIKVKKDDDEKYVRLPKKKGTYYVKVSKLTDKTTGAYYIGTYKE